MAVNTLVDFAVSMIFLLVLALGFFNYISTALAGLFLFFLLFLVVIGASKPQAEEDVGEEYLERERVREERKLRRKFVDSMIERVDVLIEKVKYLRVLLRGEVLIAD